MYKGGNKMIYTMLYPSPVGKLLLAEEDGALIGLWLEGQNYFMEPIGGMPMEPASTPALNRAAEWLDRYFAGERPAAGELRLAPAGSEFRKEVWKILCEIPWGEVSTYGEISGKIAAGRGLKHMSAQAVGGAVGHNPISIIIPCHRVVGSGGSLTGYAGGIDKKIWLLTHAGISLDGCFVPERGTARQPQG